MDFAPGRDQHQHILRRPCSRDLQLELLHPHRDLVQLRVAKLKESPQRIGMTERALMPDRSDNISASTVESAARSCTCAVLISPHARSSETSSAISRKIFNAPILRFAALLLVGFVAVATMRAALVMCCPRIDGSRDPLGERRARPAALARL
jgi:hypothetical protein